jgi:hypothetical protein
MRIDRRAWIGASSPSWWAPSAGRPAGLIPRTWEWWRLARPAHRLGRRAHRAGPRPGRRRPDRRRHAGIARSEGDRRQLSLGRSPCVPARPAAWLSRRRRDAYGIGCGRDARHRLRWPDRDDGRRNGLELADVKRWPATEIEALVSVWRSGRADRAASGSVPDAGKHWDVRLLTGVGPEPRRGGERGTARLAGGAMLGGSTCRSTRATALTSRAAISVCRPGQWATSACPAERHVPGRSR